MTNKQFISAILSFLEQEHIEDCERLSKIPEVLTTSTNCYNEFGRNWIFKIYNTVKEYFEGFSSDSSRPFHFVSAELTDNTLKYMCIFPSSLVLTEPFISHSVGGTAGTEYRINRSFLELILNNREYIEHEIFSLLPRSFDLAMAYSSGWSVTTLSGCYSYPTTEYWKKNPIELLDSNGVVITNEKINDLFIKFPFLYGAKIGDYINITEKYENHYRLYRCLIQKFIKDLYNNAKSIEDLYYEMQQAHQQMQIQFEIERRQLIKKGVRAVVGIAIACIPLALDIPADLRAFLQTILGAVSLKEFGNDILETQKKLNELQQNPYFVTWRWNRKSANALPEF